MFYVETNYNDNYLLIITLIRGMGPALLCNNLPILRNAMLSAKEVELERGADAEGSGREGERKLHLEQRGREGESERRGDRSKIAVPRGTSILTRSSLV